MALRPEELDFMQRFASGASPADLRSHLDSMYGPVTPEQQAAAFGGPDLRTASNAPAMGAPDASLADVVAGFNAQTAPVPQPVAAHAAPAGPTTSASLMANPPTVAAPAAAAAAAAAVPEAAAGPVAAEPAAAEPEQSPEQRGIQRYLLGAGRPGGAYQPGGEQLAERTIKQDIRAPMNPETAQALEDAGVDQQGLAVAQGESAAQNLEKQAAQQATQAQQARAELASYKRNTAAKEAEYDIRRGEIDDMRAQIQREPITFFSGDTTGHAVTKAIGLSMLGLLAGPMAVMQAVNNSIAQKEKEQGQAITMLDDQLDRFKAGIPDPQARALYVRSLGMDAAAAEADRMANMAKAEDARQRGFALAEGFRMEALKARAAAETAGQGTEEIKTKNMPGKWTGGGKSAEEQIIERGKKAGYSAEQSLAYAIHGGLPSGGGEPQTEFDLSKRKYERSVSVRLPSGQEVSAGTEKRADSIQRSLQAAESTQAIYDDIAKLREQKTLTGQLDREALGRVKANTAALMLSLSEGEKSEGVGLRINQDMASLLEPLTGAGAEDWVVGDQFDASLKRARELSRAGEAQALHTLSKSAYKGDYLTTPAGGKGSTFKPHAAPKEGEH